jgi:hypothetical protein
MRGAWLEERPPLFAEPPGRILPWAACLCVGIGPLVVLDDVCGLEAKEVARRGLRSLGPASARAPTAGLRAWPRCSLSRRSCGDTDAVRAKFKVVRNLELEDEIEYILITLTAQEQANLAMARYKRVQIEQ